MNGEKIYWCHQGKDKHKADKAMNKFKSETTQVGNVLSSFFSFYNETSSKQLFSIKPCNEVSLTANDTFHTYVLFFFYDKQLLCHIKNFLLL